MVLGNRALLLFAKMLSCNCDIIYLLFFSSAQRPHGASCYTNTWQDLVPAIKKLQS